MVDILKKSLEIIYYLLKFREKKMNDIDRILKSIPEWNGINGITYEPLNGYLTNVTYKINVDKKKNH